MSFIGCLWPENKSNKRLEINKQEPNKKLIKRRKDGKRKKTGRGALKLKKTTTPFRLTLRKYS